MQSETLDNEIDRRNYLIARAVERADRLPHHVLWNASQFGGRHHDPNPINLKHRIEATDRWPKFARLDQRHNNPRRKVGQKSALHIEQKWN